MSQGHAVIGSLLTHGRTQTNTNYTKHQRYEEEHAENAVTVCNMETQGGHIDDEYTKSKNVFI